MNNLIIHRGPDDDGVFVETNDKYSVALGMRRLSIIDLSNGTQPMYSDDEYVIIVFNGEIYNFKSIRDRLPDYPFTTQGDTEVILAAWAAWGPACLQWLNGMFAFAIWDNLEKELFLVRDELESNPCIILNKEIP